MVLLALGGVEGDWVVLVGVGPCCCCGLGPCCVDPAAPVGGGCGGGGGAIGECM